jgi:response regulator RpfG family c-di-GMP phosphodiesterase
MVGTMSPPVVLLVSSDPKSFSNLTRELIAMNVCEVRIAGSAADALDRISKSADIAVVLCDCPIPDMDGINFLMEVQKLNPNITRVVMTASPGADIAIRAINCGPVFRFLVKPCPTDFFVSAIKNSIRQYQYLSAEQVKISETVNGSVKMLTDLISVLNPEIFAKSNRLREMARNLAMAVNVEQIWEVEMAAFLCQVGCVTIPRQTLENWKRGITLNEAEKSMVKSIPRIGRQLVQNLPSLQNVGTYIECQRFPYSVPNPAPNMTLGKNIPIGGRILKVIVDFDDLYEQSGDRDMAIQEMIRRTNDYDPELLAVFTGIMLGLEGFRPGQHAAATRGDRPIKIRYLIVGMILGQDVLDKDGRLVVARGTVVTDTLKARLETYARINVIFEPLIVKGEMAI